jgi:hypothetical protein
MAERDINKMIDEELAKSEDGAAPVEDVESILKSFEKEDAAKAEKAPGEIDFETLEKLEDVKGKVRDAVRSNVADSANMLVATLESTGVLDAEAVNNAVMENVSHVSRLPEFAKMNLKQASGEMAKLAREAMADALEAAMIKSNDQDAVSQLEKAADRLRSGGAQEKAA